MAPCSTCSITHPTVLGAPADCVRALRKEIDFLLTEKSALASRVLALETRSASTMTAAPILATIPAASVAFDPTPAVVPPLPAPPAEGDEPATPPAIPPTPTETAG